MRRSACRHFYNFCLRTVNFRPLASLTQSFVGQGSIAHSPADLLLVTGRLIKSAKLFFSCG